MKLVNAKLYEEQIKRKMWGVWYDEKYQYYFGNTWRRDFSLDDNNNNGYQRTTFAVLNNNDELIGCIGYYIDDAMRVAQWLGAINFSDDKFAFGKAIQKVITDCFLKFGMEVVEWQVTCGNPIEKSYDKMCEKFGGRIIGIRRHRTKDMAGNTCDEKSYEIVREDFLNAIKKRQVE